MNWTTVPNFTSYEVSESGCVRNKKTQQILKQSVLSNGNGIPVVSLRNNGSTTVFDVRFLVACCYLGADITANPKPKLAYKDNNKFNNSYTNIEILTTDCIENEIWKPVPQWETSYAISNKGRVKRLERTDKYVRSDTGKEVERKVAEKILSPGDSQGYYEVNLREGERSEYHRVHRMVAEVFLLNSDNLPEVNHKDGNKHNNEVENLEWCSRLYNVQHSIETGLRSSAKGTDRSAKAIKCIETGQVFKNAKEAAQALRLSYNYLMDCMHKGKECHGYHLEQVALDLRVKCIDTGEIFNTLADAKEKFKSDAIADSIKRRTCMDGWTFCYTRDNVNEAEYLQECRNRYSQWPRANKRWEDNNK